MLPTAPDSGSRTAQSLIEYVLILTLVAILVVATLMSLGRRPESQSSSSGAQEKELAP